MQNVKTQLLRRRGAATISSPLISASSGDRDRLPGDPDLPGYGDGLAGEYVDHLAAAYADGPPWICKGLWCLWLSIPYKRLGSSIFSKSKLITQGIKAISSYQLQNSKRQEVFAFLSPRSDILMRIWIGQRAWRQAAVLGGQKACEVGRLLCRVGPTSQPTRPPCPPTRLTVLSTARLPRALVPYHQATDQIWPIYAANSWLALYLIGCRLS